MNRLVREFVADTNAWFGGRLRSPKELFNQQFAADQCLDAADMGCWLEAELSKGGREFRSAKFRMDIHFEHFLQSAGTATKLEKGRTPLSAPWQEH